MIWASFANSCILEFLLIKKAGRSSGSLVEIAAYEAQQMEIELARVVSCLTIRNVDSD